MVNGLIKNIWTQFTEIFGVSIIHPQSTLLKFQAGSIKEAKKYAKGELIDIGCGRMPYRKQLEPLVKSYTGVDHPKISKLYLNSKPEVLADAKKLPFKENSFNIALLLQVLEHVDNPQKVIKEAARVLKPNGILIISVPFFYPLHDMPYDFGRYTESAIKNFLKGANLHPVKIETQGGFFEFWLQMLNTFLVKRINDMVLNFKFQTIFLLIPTVAFSIPIILLNNMLIFIASYITKVLPKYPNYFPLEYFVIAKKKL